MNVSVQTLALMEVIQGRPLSAEMFFIFTRVMLS